MQPCERSQSASLDGMQTPESALHAPVSKHSCRFWQASFGSTQHDPCMAKHAPSSAHFFDFWQCASVTAKHCRASSSQDFGGRAAQRPAWAHAVDFAQSAFGPGWHLLYMSEHAPHSLQSREASQSAGIAARQRLPTSEHMPETAQSLDARQSASFVALHRHSSCSHRP
jgi:hypothetical protein